MGDKLDYHVYNGTMGRPRKTTPKRGLKTTGRELEKTSLPALPAIEILRAIPEEQVWLEGQQSEQTRRAYRADVVHFMRTLGITETDELRQVDRRAVVAWRRSMEAEGAKPRTVRRRLSALSSLFSHLVDKHVVSVNPVREIKRPRVNRRQGTTAAFSAAQARKLLDAPDPETLQGLRDRAILSVGLQAGPRRSEIASLRVRDFHVNAGFDSLHFIRKGGEDHSMAIHPQTAQRIRDYLEAAGHGDDRNGPLFRAVRQTWLRKDDRAPLDPDMIDRILRKYAKKIGLKRGFSAHSMRATFITTTLENGASLEEVQRAAGHADASTTKLYDRRGYNPEKSASFFASY